jgi:colicin import membrane protein
MPSAYDRTDFAPPEDARSVRAFGLALLAHILLIGALTWGINWKRTDQSPGYEAEIWSAVPQQVAPRLIETPPPVPQPAPVQPAPPPPPQPEVKAPEAKAPPPAPDVDIALEQEKKRKQLAQQKEVEAKKLAEKQQALEVAKKEKELKAKEEQTKRLAADEDKKREAQLDAQKLAKKQNDDKQAQAAVQKQRQEALDRMMGLAGANGGAKDTGTALRSSGPSASYAGRLRAAIRPNVVFSGDINGDPVATVEVRVMSDGTVVSQRVIKSSGDKSWDDAAVNAIIRTRVLPRDVDGRMPDNILHIEMRPRG